MSNKCDKDLEEFLTNCDPIVVATLSEMMDTFTDFDTNDLRKFKDAYMVTCTTIQMRIELAQKIVKLLKYFGSHDVAYLARKMFTNDPGVSYDEILRDVIEEIVKQNKLKITIPRVCSIEDKETLLCEIMLQSAINGKSEAELSQMLSEAGLDAEQAKESAKTIAKTGGAGVGIILLVRLLGKKAVKEIIYQIVVKLIASKVGKEAAEKIAQKILAKTAQKTIAKLVSGLGWVLLVFDVVSIMSPAMRITIPCVAFISSIRVAERLNA